MTKSCTHCHRVKNTPIVSPLHPWNWPTISWQRIYVDFAGSFQGQMFLIVVYSHLKWPAVITMKKPHGRGYNKGTPLTIFVLWNAVSDNGPQFVSDKFQPFLKGNGVKYIHAAEHFEQMFKKAICAQKADCFHQQLMSCL